MLWDWVLVTCTLTGKSKSDLLWQNHFLCLDTGFVCFTPWSWSRIRIVWYCAVRKQTETFCDQIHVVGQPLDNAYCIRLCTRLRLNWAHGRIHPLKFRFLFSQTVLTHVRYHLVANDNLFWPSNKLFQNVLKIIHGDLMNSVMIFVLLFSFAPSWI